MFTLPEAKSLSQKAYHAHQNPWILLSGAGIVIIATVLFYIFPNIKLLNEVKKDIEVTKASIVELNMEIRAQEKEKEKVSQELELFTEKYGPRLKKAFPDQENIGALTRFLEDFSIQLEQTGTMNLSNISYGKSKEEKEYSILPVRLSFEANNINFVRFMQMIKSSGSIDEKDFYEGSPVRLMRVEHMTVNIPKFSEDSDAEQIYSVNMEISAFFRNKS